MSASEALAQKTYRGIWAILANWFRVPRTAPDVPGRDDQTASRFKPAQGFLRYLRMVFWIIAIIIDVALTVGYVAVAITLWMNDLWWVALLLLPVYLVIAIVPDVFAYVALHLRYDTTWYVMTDRSVRIRRGIWSITEMTVTFENVQNVNIKQGPIQRIFGISDLTIETAGAGAAGSHGVSVANQARIEGIDNPEELREQILQRLRAAKSAGLGDDDDDDDTRIATAGATWTPAHLDALRAIRNEVVSLRSA